MPEYFIDYFFYFIAFEYIDKYLEDVDVPK